MAKHYIASGSPFRRFDDHGDDKGCWDWLGRINTYGYGTVKKSRYGTAMAHRLFYERYVGEIPHGKEIDHKCRNRRCVNPDHLEPVTKAENQRRGLNCKLDWDRVRELRRRWKARSQTQKVLAKEFGISIKQCQEILYGESWKE